MTTTIDTRVHVFNSHAPTAAQLAAPEWSCSLIEFIRANQAMAGLEIVALIDTGTARVGGGGAPCFTVMTDAALQAACDAAGIPPVLGAAIGGGFLGAVYFDDDGRRVGLITAPASSEIEAVFKTSRTADPGARSLHDGLANSEAMNDAEHPAAQHCRALRIGGKDDWHLPSRRDIYRLAETCMPGAGNVPQQTTAAAFREGGAAAFQRAWYWSSTECTSGFAWVQLFTNGYQYYTGKDWSCRVRAVRKCPL